MLANKPLTIEGLNLLVKIVLLALLTALSAQVKAINVTTTDAIPDDQRSHFNGFEGMTGPAHDLGAIYTEDNIRVEQVNGQRDDITTNSQKPGFDGMRSWYPNGGDWGYTKITLSNGRRMNAIGLMRASGGRRSRHLLYELWDYGRLVQAGSVDHQYSPAIYIGFSGDEFSELRIRDAVSPRSLDDGTGNALAIDSIEVIVAKQTVATPVPSLPIFGWLVLSLLVGMLGALHLQWNSSSIRS